MTTAPRSARISLVISVSMFRCARAVTEAILSSLIAISYLPCERRTYVCDPSCEQNAPNTGRGANPFVRRRNNIGSGSRKAKNGHKKSRPLVSGTRVFDLLPRYHPYCHIFASPEGYPACDRSRLLLAWEPPTMPTCSTLDFLRQPLGGSFSAPGVAGLPPSPARCWPFFAGTIPRQRGRIWLWWIIYHIVRDLSIGFPLIRNRQDSYWYSLCLCVSVVSRPQNILADLGALG